jgi:LPS sulfotransferase NodH
MSHERLRLHIESWFVKRPGRLAGAKLMTFHLDELPIGLPEILELLAQPKVIVLYRENLLEQYTSFRMALQHGVWHVKKPKNLAPIWLDPEDFQAWAERERRMWRASFAALEGTRYHALTYEQLASRPQSTMREVFNHLGVAAARARSRLVKICPKPLRQKVVNHRQFADRRFVWQASLALPPRRQHEAVASRTAYVPSQAA